MILLAYLTGTVTGTLTAWAWHRYAGALLLWLFSRGDSR